MGGRELEPNVTKSRSRFLHRQKLREGRNSLSTENHYVIRLLAFDRDLPSPCLVLFPPPCTPISLARVRCAALLYTLFDAVSYCRSLFFFFLVSRTRLADLFRGSSRHSLQRKAHIGREFSSSIYQYCTQVKRRLLNQPVQQGMTA